VAVRTGRRRDSHLLHDDPERIGQDPDASELKAVDVEDAASEEVSE
jgi:hypothetical protein